MGAELERRRLNKGCKAQRGLMDRAINIDLRDSYRSRCISCSERSPNMVYELEIASIIKTKAGRCTAPR